MLYGIRGAGIWGADIWGFNSIWIKRGKECWHGIRGTRYLGPVLLYSIIESQLSFKFVSSENVVEKHSLSFV